MDHENDSVCKEVSDWNDGDYCFPEETNPGVPQCLWNGVSQSGEDLSCIFYETTPVKACGDLAYQVDDNVNMDKVASNRRETSSKMKRRRMLQFHKEALDLTWSDEEMPSVFLKEKDREESFEEALSDISEWVSKISEDTSEYMGPDQLSDGWLADCVNNFEMNRRPIEALSGVSDVQLDSSDFSDAAPKHQTTIVQERPALKRRNFVHKGRKLCARTKSKLAPYVAYPFDIIKPSNFRGDMTLKEINYRLHNPSSSKKKKNCEDLSSYYPNSAYSGKPVVAKTKINIEGGEGSISIMTTKG